MRPIPPFLGALSVAAMLLSVGCTAGGLGSSSPRDGTPYSSDTDPTSMDDVRGPCETDADCDAGVCLEFGGSRRCVVRSGDRPPGDGTECGPCDGECREGVCIHPDGSGEVCEFDPECGPDELCISGRCTHDPRIPIPCGEGGACPDGLSCSMAGECICATTADCPIGFVCTGDGRCDPGDGCAADADCGAGMVCEGGLCIPSDHCGVVHPDLTGDWTMLSELRLREVLPGWLDGFLGAVAGPFHFIAGHTTELDLGLPSFVEDLVADVIRDWADTHLTPWQRSLLGGIADLNDILSTWYVAESMRLDAVARDVYRGSHTWDRVEFMYRGMRVSGRPEDIIDWRFTPEEFDATSVCGIFNIHRHDIDVSIGAIIAWVVDTIVYEASDGRYTTLEDALTDATAGFCDGAASAAGDAVDFPGVSTAVYAACSSTLRDLVSTAVSAVRDARLGLDLMSLKGHAPIVSDRSLEPGVWEGTLAGGDFTGDFTASR